MRVITLLGALVIIAGGLVFARGLSFSTKDKVVDLGAVEVSADKKHTIPPWAGGIAVLAGVVMVVSGLRGRGA